MLNSLKKNYLQQILQDYEDILRSNMEYIFTSKFNLQTGLLQKWICISGVKFNQTETWSWIIMITSQASQMQSMTVPCYVHQRDTLSTPKEMKKSEFAIGHAIQQSTNGWGVGEGVGDIYSIHTGNFSTCGWDVNTNFDN